MPQKPDEPKKDDRSFIREYIKDKPRSRRTVVLSVLTALLLGVVFGGSAAITYRLGTGAGTSAADSATADAIAQADDASGTDTQEDSADQETDTAAEIAAAVAAAEEELDLDLEISDYQKLKYELYAIGRQAGKAVVTVAATSQGTDLFQADYESTDQSMGLVLSEGEDEILILTQYESLKGAEEICVIFSNDESVDARIMAYDANTSLAVISVDAADVSDAAGNTIEAASLQMSGVVSQGQIVVAIGAPTGSMYSVLDGTVISNSTQLSFDDGVYTLYTTSMQAAENTTAALVNADGEIVGLMMETYRSDSDGDMLTAVSVKELYPVIEKLTEGESIAYLGVSITTVTSSLAEEYGIPEGVYVRDVTEDSPAYDAGIQPGDIIVQIGSVQITSVSELMSDLLTREPDESASVTVMRASADEYAEVSCNVKFSQK